MKINQLIEELPGTDSASIAVGMQPSGPCCDQCEAPQTARESLVCQHCGWYASIGSYVEIDRSWEIAASPELATEADAAPKPKAELPTWAWILIGCVATVVLESVAVRLLAPADGLLRTYWSLTQLFVGFVAFGVCHTYSFILVMRNEADTKMLDYVLRPFKSWAMISCELPERGWACYFGMSGLTAVVMSLLVIGGIPYERLLDWDVEKTTKTNLLGAIISQAQNIAAEEEKSLEEAIGDFAGKAGLDEKKAKEAEKARLKEDCIIIGYKANQAGEIQTLLLAAEHHGVLRHVGNVQVNDLPEKELRELTRKLMTIKTHRPFVQVSIGGATWVKPQQLCRVSYRRRGKQGGLYGAKVEYLLGEVDLSGQ